MGILRWILCHEAQSSVVENEISAKVLGMVNALLGEEKANIENNAWQCGLDSIDAMKLTALLREQFEIDLRLATVLESRHWGELASQIELIVNAKTTKLITAAKEEKELPLSAQQLPLWFLDQAGMESEVSAIQTTLRCVGKLYLPAVEYALNALIHQHEILRTRLRIGDNGEACQVVLPAEPIELTNIDQRISKLTWEQVQDTQISKRFDLANDQLLRSLVYRCDDDEHLLMFHSHLIALDGWSFDLLHAQFVEHYRYYDAMNSEGDTADQSVTVKMPAPDNHQYRDFVQWQKSIKPQALQTDTEHWCEVLAEPRESLELPLDFTRPARGSYKGGSVVHTIDDNTIARWSMLAQETQATPFMVALAAVKTGLRSVLGVNDLLIGTAVSNRTEPRWQKMPGLFSNTVVIRTKSGENDTFVESVLQTRTATLDALQHENVPIDQIVSSLGIHESAGQHPLFDVFFIYQHQHESVPSVAGVKFELVNQTELKTAKFDLTVEIRPTSQLKPRGYELHLNYSTDLFHKATIEGLAVELLSVMSATAQQSGKIILELLPSAQPKVIDAAPKPPVTETAINGTNLLISQRLDQVFHTQSLNSPNSIALLHNDQCINYTELDNLVDRIQKCLSQAGITPGEVVAVSLPRSIHQIAVALAVSRCEAVWCPIDRTTMLHIVVDPVEEPANLIPRLVALGDKNFQVIDVAASRQRHENCVAVLMYTSGTTGKPKGVLLSHQAIMNRFVWMWNRYPFANDDVNVVKTSCSFVDSLWESFGALLACTPSVIIDDADVTDMKCFLTALRINKVTRVLVAPSFLTTMLDALTMYDQILPDLRLCSCSGEVLPAQLAARFLAKQPHSRILNLYGSTEVAADVTCQEIVSTDELEKLPLGPVIDGINVYILNQQRKVVPPGESGEVAFAGLGLAIGYHRDAELTAQKFIELEGVGRVVLSGDIGHIDNFGRLQFEGRQDRQVKVRGIRVNCHEVEQQINSLPRVVHSLVFAQGELEERNLCAVVQTNDDNNESKSFDSTDFSEQLQKLLPAHQLPDRFQLVNALPMLPNGKPDLNAAASLMDNPSTITEHSSKAEPKPKRTNSALSISDDSFSADINLDIQ